MLGLAIALAAGLAAEASAERAACPTPPESVEAPYIGGFVEHAGVRPGERMGKPNPFDPKYQYFHGCTDVVIYEYFSMIESDWSAHVWATDRPRDNPSWISCAEDICWSDYSGPPPAGGTQNNDRILQVAWDFAASQWSICLGFESLADGSFAVQVDQGAKRISTPEAGGNWCLNSTNSQAVLEELYRGKHVQAWLFDASDGSHRVVETISSDLVGFAVLTDIQKHLISQINRH